MDKAIKIKVYNDCKERHNSYEASIENFNEYETGYGATEKEAVDELKIILQRKIEQLQNLKELKQ